MVKVKVILEQIIEVDVDSLSDLDMELPSDMEEVDILSDESFSVTTELVSSEIIS